MKRRKKRELVELYDNPIRINNGRYALFPKKWNFFERCAHLSKWFQTTQEKKHLNLKLAHIKEKKEDE